MIRAIIMNRGLRVLLLYASRALIDVLRAFRRYSRKGRPLLWTARPYSAWHCILRLSSVSVGLRKTRLNFAGHAPPGTFFRNKPRFAIGVISPRLCHPHNYIRPDPNLVPEDPCRRLAIQVRFVDAVNSVVGQERVEPQNWTFIFHKGPVKQ